ncbi:succinate dehydrogenase/fumarate reductase iron-sulfur subunit [Bacillus sp. DTU_2020_1000418_1_SI_GHA_SEK_038]|uniref:succinate dehydrogenase/fumarate reductase iron-sulfur subunit n=1 Tax=Bacillus sp. DTU_2020_1000418_1_SI_GHA_SEK_038 TaxID=3077585 RepID=UPI0028EB0CE7|nr:succinate dehydrogenase/fumarate reductase iron-sulfur subunit [Bacillus sp. DTU_2020_1000418_1_SI_GHA_SEK_038]WNS76220.1 succinate dehydrogenase/fumarate reductase iron-sulfur subunit [Bacillus sp. DTU_2020_1000418_1_SI_GHA_SEK_038]
MKDVEVTVMRFDPHTDDEPKYETFQIEAKKNMTVLDSLFLIVEDQDPSLSFRCACRLGMCGSCGMVINGRGRLACRTKIEHLGDKILVQPMRNMDVIKDLAVNMDSFFQNWEKVKPYFVPKEDTDEFAIIPPSSGRREIIDENQDCITCGLCFQSCNTVSLRGVDEFIGPAALNRAYNLIADERDGARGERLDMVIDTDGAFGCRSFSACVEVCPKGIKPMATIKKIKMKQLKRAIGMKW